jgi:iron-sulfur cluster repair protein YtfE (RIC family)
VEGRSAGAEPAEWLSQVLVREHGEIDGALKACADVPVPGPEARAALKRAVGELRRHIYVEEELLFPPLQAAGMTGPILVMLREHAQMWPVLATLDRELVQGVGDDELRRACRQLLVLLQHHNPKEEQIIYPQVDHVVGDDKRHGALELLNTGQMPQGWICHLLRPRNTAAPIKAAPTEKEIDHHGDRRAHR